MSETGFGASVEAGGATFRLWAPGARTVDLLLDKPLAMRAEADGWFVAVVDGLQAGALYNYRIDNELTVPDPASAFQPQDVTGPSEVIDHASYQWRHNDWKGRPWQETVILETHVGAFTADGTYQAMIDKLDHLVATGITALELMPLNDFAGRRNWGYDGVLWYAPDSAYGRPDDLKALIDAAHGRGLMVFLDAVYNHFGPEGNYLGRYAPAFFTEANTPWGAAIDYRVPQVRAFAIQSALQWLRDYRFDGLRLDAVHEIVEDEYAYLLGDLSRAVGALARHTGRHIHLMLENDDNRASLLDPRTDPPDGKFRAQWNDDYHHAWHVLLTGETNGYYRDYAPHPLPHISRALNSGFAYQGEASQHRNDQPRGEASVTIAPMAFINFLQNHDQIGNRALGDRLTTIADPAAIDTALAITLLAPGPPMLFMGEEWGSKRPFPFFCDFKGDLARAVRDGRRSEFRSAYEIHGDDIPDPLEEATFLSAKLDWDALDHGLGQYRLALVRELLAVRRREIVPHLADASFDPLPSGNENDSILAARWRLGDKRLWLLANVSGQPQPAPTIEDSGTPIWGNRPLSDLRPWSVIWSIR
jgi:maltooligosyltrehalose trehalohydrolase